MTIVHLFGRFSYPYFVLPTSYPHFYSLNQIAWKSNLNYIKFTLRYTKIIYIFLIGLTHLTRYGRMFVMRFTFKRFKNVRKTSVDYKQQMLIKQAREQFEALVKKGIGVPIVLL